jgi:quercetin dioxygenase-like cupin family protein
MRLIGCGTVVALLSAALVSTQVQAPSPQAPAVHKLATTLRGSGCSEAGIETGDPTKGPSIVVEKFAPGCAIPWHWHTPNEHVMMVSGTFRFEIQGEASVQVNPGDFVFIPSHHTSQTTCLGPDACINFLYTDAPADMHFVDETGAEISSEQAQKNYAKTHPKQ